MSNKPCGGRLGDHCPGGDWLQLTTCLMPDHVEPWELALASVGALSVTYRDAGDRPVFEPAPGQVKLWQNLEMTALFAQNTDLDGLLLALCARLGPEAVARVRLEQLADQQWERTWLDDFAPLSFGQRLWICPCDVQPPDPWAVNLRLDPGLAFGTGTHPTTAMCLRWLDAHEVSGKTVVDFGCGSGVLGIAALLLGAAKVYAIDIDEQALEATASNARINLVADSLHVCPPDDMPDVQVDIVMANILAEPLIALANTLSAYCAPLGQIVLSGLLADQVDDVWRVYQTRFASPRIDYDAEWAHLCAEKNN